MEPLVDSYGRRVKSMRISITDKCNFRCIYCMPTEGLPWLPKREFLSYEEIERVARVAVSIGIEQIQLTGGEPLVRRDIPELIRLLHSKEIKKTIEAEYGPLILITTADRSETACRYTFSDGIDEIGFINPVSEPFCASCDRIRLTADGQLRVCLLATEETDLRSIIRSGTDDETLAYTLHRAVRHKELKHLIGDKQFKRANHSMSMIGG